MTQNIETHYTHELAALYMRNYKDTLFRLIFREKKNLLSLYNAMNETHYSNPDDLEIVTLENAIYLGMKNDIAFLLYDELYLYEHQSTPNPNIPLRDLFYIAREYEKMIDKRSLYGSRKIILPTPHFIMFYNGSLPQPERTELRLSDLFARESEAPSLELVVHMYNINANQNPEIMNQCKMLRDYAKYVDRVRKYAILLPIGEAVERAIKECIAEDILAELLTKYRREVIQVSIFEFDAEKEFKLLREAEREAGFEEGRDIGWHDGWQDGVQRGCEQGLKQGREQGERRFATLSQHLITDHRTEDLLKATQDTEYRQTLYEEYKL
ncbi:MAG: hypothetical protein IJY09_02375 [Lachnospiraceae bacterium]|nr:hypothetical protein [Lachnospiraceae bacterium]